MTTVLYFKRLKYFLILNAGLFFICGHIIYSVHFKVPKVKKDNQRVEKRGENTYESIEYHYETGGLRAKQFLKNGKKDSVWTTFGLGGQIIEQNVYRNDTLVKKIF